MILKYEGPKYSEADVMKAYRQGKREAYEDAAKIAEELEGKDWPRIAPAIRSRSQGETDR